MMCFRSGGFNCNAQSLSIKYDRISGELAVTTVAQTCQELQDTEQGGSSKGTGRFGHNEEAGPAMLSAASIIQRTDKDENGHVA
jgi:hypothetical protein